VQLGTTTWPEVEAVAGAALLVVPIGSTEQHGPHLPLDTDTRIAVALAERLALARPSVVVAPPLPYGASGEHAAFPGTLLMDHRTLAGVLTELVRSARATFAGVLLLSAHGGNQEALALVAATAEHEGDAVVTWSPNVPGGDAHAGRTETSLLLALCPELVRLERAEPGRTESLADLLPQLRAEGVRPISSNGVLGDPQGASADEGRALLEALTTQLESVVDVRWTTLGGAG
jgi:mycofactocin system creatininase family protein